MGLATLARLTLSSEVKPEVWLLLPFALSLPCLSLRTPIKSPDTTAAAMVGGRSVNGAQKQALNA